jgi:hypothetical protein
VDWVLQRILYESHAVVAAYGVVSESMQLVENMPMARCASVQEVDQFAIGQFKGSSPCIGIWRMHMEARSEILRVGKLLGVDTQIDVQKTVLVQGKCMDWRGAQGPLGFVISEQH